MSENKKVIIVPLKKKPPPSVVTSKAKQWSPTSKPIATKKPPLPKAPLAAQPADDNRKGTKLRKVADLKTHPLQNKFFNNLPDAQFADLVKNIETEGLKEPIENLADGTIISGHQRWRAANRLGWTEVSVIIRHDLAAASPVEIELALIEANCHRRQLSKIEQARSYKRIREIKESSGKHFSRGDLRNECAKRFNMSGRNLDRYVALLNHSKELQDAVDGKKLSLVKALRLMDLPAEKYKPILRKLRDGQDVRREVDAMLPDAAKAPLTDKKFERGLRSWLWEAEQLSQDTERVVQALGRHTMVPLRDRHLARLRAAQTLVAEMLELLGPDEEDPDAGDDDQDALGDDLAGDDQQDADFELIDPADPYGCEPPLERDDQETDDADK